MMFTFTAGRRPLRNALIALIASTASLITAPVATAEPGALVTTVPELQCAASAPIFTTHTDGTFAVHQHLEPETGLDSWGPQQQITTWGLNARRIAGPNGIIYSALSNGELLRRRWTGTSWGSFADSDPYQVIDTNPLWARYSTPEYRNRITVDADGYIYTVEPDGNLHVRIYNPTTRIWTHRVVDSDWGRFNLIVAAGPGDIFARESATGALYHLSYRTESERVLDFGVEWVSNAGQSWGNLIRMTSPGAGLLYGVTNNGELRWWQFNKGDDSVEPAAGKLIDTGRQDEYETFAAPDSCWLTGVSTPTRPPIAPQPFAPVSLQRSSNGHVHYSYVDGEGRAVYVEIPDLTGGQAAAAAVPGLTGVTGTTSTAENQDGRIQIVARGLNAEVYTNVRTAANGPWGQTVTLDGFLKNSPILVRQTDNALAVYSLDEEEVPWLRDQAGPNGPLIAWHHPRGAYGNMVNGNLSVVLPVNNEVVNLVGGGDGYITVDTYWYTIDGDWSTDSVMLGTDRAGFLPGATAVLGPDNSLQLFATDEDGLVRAQRGIFRNADHDYAYPGVWTPVPAVTAAGRPSAILAPDGKLQVVVRGTDDYVYYTSETAPGSLTFTPWQEITNFTEQTATDPTALAVPESNTWVVAYRTDLDIPRLRRYQPAGPAAVSTAFADIPIAAPS